MKTNNKALFSEVATSIGRAAGTVKGEIDNIVGAAHPEAAPKHPDVHFESSDFNIRAVFLTGLGVLVGTWVLTGLLYFLFSYLAQERASVSPPPLPIARTRESVPPQPRLQQSPSRDLRVFRAHEDWELTHYHWIDQAHGTLAIPIRQAMQLVVERGIPPAKLAPNPTLTPPAEGTRLTGFEGKVEPEPQ